MSIDDPMMASMAGRYAAALFVTMGLLVLALALAAVRLLRRIDTA